jgi:hypothetical protein
MAPFGSHIPAPGYRVINGEQAAAADIGHRRAAEMRGLYPWAHLDARYGSRLVDEPGDVLW